MSDVDAGLQHISIEIEAKRMLDVMGKEKAKEVLPRLLEIEALSPVSKDLYTRALELANEWSEKAVGGEEIPEALKIYPTVKMLDGDRYGAIYPLLYTDAIITGKVSAPMFIDERWCFEKGKATDVLLAWDGEGEPEGWHRHPNTGRRRPDGDASKEYVEV